MYLLDTNVVSELRKARTGKANQGVCSWANSIATHLLFMSVVSVMELELGVRAKERKDPAQGEVLRNWLHSQVLPAFEGRLLAIDLPVALSCASLHVPDPRPERDAFLAATALAAQFTLVTRNTRDFERTGVSLLNPWSVA